MMTRVFLAAFVCAAFANQAHAQMAPHGAGATLSYPLLSKWFEAYQRETGVRVVYEPIGNGAGRAQLRQKSVDFAVTEMPLDASTRAAMPYPVREIPIAASAVAIVYNLGEVPDLRLSGEVLADIFRGQITRWNDPRLKAINPGAKLPKREIHVIKRADGNASTWAVTQFVNASSTKHRHQPGAEISIGLSGKSGTGDFSSLYRRHGSLAYVESAYAVQNKFQTASIRNRDGAFVRPDVANVVAALAAASPRQVGAAPSIFHPRGDNSYPIVVISTLLIPKKPTFEARNFEVRRFARWALNSGQKYAAPMRYAPLPQTWRAHSHRELDTLQP